MATDAGVVEALRLVREWFGVDRPSVEVLLAQASAALGPERTARCVECLRSARLSRRGNVCAALATIIVAVRSLEPEWWRRPHRELVRAGAWETRTTPDNALQTGVREWPTPLERVSYWALDAVAERAWGPAVDFLDFNSQVSSDRVPVPLGARPDQRLLLDWDPGARIDAVVVERADGTLGTELDFGSERHVDAEDAGWGWAIAAGLGPHRLPDEDAGSASDPYSATVDASVAQTLRAWALGEGLDDASVRGSWQTVEDVVRAVVAADLNRRSGRWMSWWRATHELIDGNTDKARAFAANVPPTSRGER